MKVSWGSNEVLCSVSSGGEQHLEVVAHVAQRATISARRVRGRATRLALLDADILVTNFQSLGTGTDAEDLLAKLGPNDIDLLVVDEAHIAAADSYLSACFGTSLGRARC